MEWLGTREGCHNDVVVVVVVVVLVGGENGASGPSEMEAEADGRRRACLATWVGRGDGVVIQVPAPGASQEGGKGVRRRRLLP